ncbi:O-antigen ligase family protein [Carboxylicivirga sp. RSCT41]|uniref:O-antigen ligase family protein n=1 Tax=Carboxylicivirga agarovorans TaxID=3417570 RepID=UPI003D3414F3
MFKITNLIYVYFLVVAFAPIVIFLDYETIDIGFNRLYGGSLILLSLLLLIKKGVNKSHFDTLLLGAFFVYIFYLVTDLVHTQGTVIRKGYVYDFFVNTSLHMFFLIYLVDNYKMPDSLFKYLILIFKGTVILAFLVSLIQFFDKPFFFTPDEISAHARRMGSYYSSFRIRRVSIFGYLGMHDISISFLPVFGILMSYYSMVKKRVPYLYLIMAFFVVFVNNSRYAQLGFLITLLPVFMLAKNKWRTALIIGVSVPAALLLLAIGLNLIGFDVEGYVEQRLLADSASTRLLAFEIFQKFFGRNPWFGTGVHLTNEVIVALAGRSSQIHVGYLAHLYSYGIIGSFFVFGFWLSIFFRFRRTAIRTAYWGSLVGILVFLWANVTLVTYQIFTYGIMMSFLFDRYYHQNKLPHAKEDSK